jgi:hypothetical protein
MTRRGELAHAKTLSELVEIFKTHFPHPDPVVAWCKKAPNLRACVERAIEGRDETGKMYSEGTRLHPSSKAEFERRLTQDHRLRLLRRAEDFEDIYHVLREARPWGIGDVTTYNCTYRIAAFKKISPKDYLYLHAGPLEGWKRLTGTKRNPYRVPIGEVPRPLRVLSVLKIEDFFCEMREALHPGLRE